MEYIIKWWYAELKWQQSWAQYGLHTKYGVPSVLILWPQLYLLNKMIQLYWTIERIAGVILLFRLNHKWFSTTIANIVRFNAWGIFLYSEKKNDCCIVIGVVSVLCQHLHHQVSIKSFERDGFRISRNWFQQEDIIVKSISEASLYLQIQYKSRFWNMFSEELNTI